jgi:hypothetical protein
MASSTFTTQDCTKHMATSSESVHILFTRHLQFQSHRLFLGPNELSIRDVNAVVPLMGSNGFPKGPRQSSNAI